MGWHEGKYYYRVGLLRYIAENYDHLYTEGIAFDGLYEEYNLFRIAEYKADFDISLKKLPRRMRKVIEAVIQGIPDRVMEMRGYYEVGKLRRMAYHRMKEILNADR